MTKSYTYSHEGVAQSVKRYALGANIQERWAEQLAEKTACAVDKWIASKNTVTESDLSRVIYKELKHISPDVAFAYRNRDKII